MVIELMDYQNEKVAFDIGDIEDIVSIEITVVSGDEIAMVFYRNGTAEIFDSSSSRLYDFYDYAYLIYDVTTGVNYLNDERFLSRETSYDVSMD